MNPSHKIMSLEEKASINADWVQVVGNGGPPCFHIDKRDGRFCFRAKRWFGHSEPGIHDFIPLDKFILSFARKESEPLLEELKNCISWLEGDTRDDNKYRAKLAKRDLIHLKRVIAAHRSKYEKGKS